MLNDQDIWQKMLPLFADLDDLHNLINANPRPLLAHYTSIQALEQILKNDEVWFSNPLFMNDLEEMRFGMNEGMRLFAESEALTQACGSPERAGLIRHAMNHYFSEFDNKHALDVYVFCLSEHDRENIDGVLSMWRGYGSQGNGAALVFNTDFIVRNDKSPLIFSKVRYASASERTEWLRKKLESLCDILRANEIADDKLSLVAYQFLNLIKVFALTSKHHGFSEEKEWRSIYLPDRDQNNILGHCFDYAISRHGVEPKLKLKIQPLPIEPRGTWTFETIIEYIILGPTISSPRTKASLLRMLEKINKSAFQKKVVASTIPLRPA